ncbi:MAG: SusC/RagA family TonB-linked outer membrane protein [Prevotellaceae bacterium]|jgi:TonB-linked SusC/RagA family outer membrane protein|nr:SusC/RagA family TonB-linked outer membrane protein [Prevotellaceae bacterium]
MNLNNLKKSKVRLIQRVCLAAGACLLLMWCITPVHAQQQSKTITGTVTDKKGEPLAGVTVSLQGTAVVSLTDGDGRYSIPVQRDNQELRFSYVGYRPVTVATAQSVVRVTLEEEALLIDEVVVTALGIKRANKAIGYAMQEVKGEDIAAGREMNAITALSGKVAGVDISTTSAGPSGSTRVIIRGNSQLSGSNLPLYVIDGVPMDNTQLGAAGQWGGYDFGDGLSAVSSDDIESISILKGASASALYGSRASNGVVLITTKSAKQGSGLGIEVSLNVNAVSLNTAFDDYQRVYGQGRDGQLIMDVTDARGSTQSAWGARLDPNLSIPVYNGQTKPYSNVNNNILSFFRTGFTTTNSVAVSKNSEAVDFRFSVSDMRNTDIVPQSDMSRTSFMFKGGARLSDKIRIEARGNYTHEYVNNRPALSDSPNNIGNALIGIAPSFDQSWLSENYKDEFGYYNQWNGNDYRINPYWSLNEMTNVSTKKRVMAHVQLNYDFLPHLTLQVKAGTDFYNFKVSEFVSMSTPLRMGGEMTERLVSVFENNYEAILRFEKTFAGIFNVSAFAGGNIMRYESDMLTSIGRDQVIPGIESITNYGINERDAGLYRKQINSLYGAVNLAYNDFAFVDVTLRNDWSSTLSRENRSYLYPSVSGSFVFSNFFGIENDTFSFGKFRASWAKVGGDTDAYQLDLTYGLRSFTFQGNSLGEISSTTIPLSGLKPTSTYSYEFGFDLRFFRNRLALDVGYYNQSTKDQILSLPITGTTGYTAAMVNAGEISNYGIEVSLTATPVKTGDFEWNSTVNFARNVNKVNSLHPQVKNYELAQARWAQAAIYASEGEAYGAIVGRKFARDPDGNVIFRNGLPTYTDDLHVLGNGNHDFTLGFNNRISYKGLSLGVLFDMKWGADLYSMSALFSHLNGTSEETLEGRQEWYASEELRRSQNILSPDWTPTGGYVGKGVKNTGTDSAPNYVPNDVPVNPQSYWMSIYENTPEPYIYDASYIKLRELTLTYQIPDNLLKKVAIKDVSVSFFARNLWVLYSNLKNIDPESNYNNGNGQGFEYGSLPSRRTYGFGLNFKF